jgi:hypothetical protein
MPSQDHGDTTAERANTIARLIEVFNDTSDRRLRKRATCIDCAHAGADRSIDENAKGHGPDAKQTRGGQEAIARPSLRICSGAMLFASEHRELRLPSPWPNRELCMRLGIGR